MAPSPPNPSRPRLGTVLSRKNWEDRRSNSTTSSVTSHGSIGDSTRGSFDPENEALVSTEPLNHSPPMKDTQANSKSKAYQIDMKAAKKAFSEGSESGSDAADISIEIGRGGRRGQQAMEDSRNNDSIHSSNAMIGDYRVMYSPPRSSNRHASTTGNNDARSLRQDAQIRLASMASHKENRDPAPQPFKSCKPSDPSAKVKRKTLGEINARAFEMYDGSLLNNDRPVQAVPATKTTRFSRSTRNPSSQAQLGGTNTATDLADINQSYILPDLPNLSQLMSGTISERTPGRTRIAAHPALSQTPRGPMHKPIDTVPIPDDEKAIFQSLNLLQDRVNELEAVTADFQKTIEELKTKNLVLKAEKRDLKADNERLRRENVELRMGQTHFDQSRQHEQRHRDRVSSQKHQQKNTSIQVNNEISRMVKERHEEDLFSLTPTESVKIRPMSAPPQASDAPGQKSSATFRSSAEHNIALSNSRRGKKVVIEDSATRTANQESQQMAREPTANQDLTYLSTQPVADYLLNLRNILEVERIDAKKRRNGKDGHEAVSNANHRASDDKGAADMAQQALPRKSSMKDISQRILPSEIAAATLAKVRAEQENYLRQAYDQDASADITDQVSRPLSQTARRNSDPTATAASNTSRRRRRTTDFEDDNMTSAFIIPDITIAQPTATAAAAAATVAETTTPGATAHLTSAAQHVIHSVNPHDASNCIICSRLTTNPSTSDPKKTVIIPKPIPVSQTSISPTPDNPDPTLRPAQAPGLALAIVLKELSDQHEHLKSKLAAAQARYQQSDPRVSRKKRARLCEEMQGLQRRCEGVADMIYRLCDVLEAAKGGDCAALEMSREEVEVTVGGLREVMGRMGREGESGDEGEDEDEDEEETE